MKHLWILATLCILTLNVSAQPAAPRYKLEKGKPYKYLVEIKSDITQEMMGQTMNITVDGTITATITATEILENGNFRCANHVENALIMVETPQGPQTLGNDLAGKTFVVEMQPNGEVVARDSLPAGINPQSMEMVGRIQNGLPKLSDNPLTVGTSWTEERSDTTQQNGAVISSSSITYTVKGIASIEGYDCAVIELEGTTESSGNITRGGMDITVSGSGKVKGTMHFAEKEGLLVRMTQESTNDQTMMIPSNNMRIPMTSQSTAKTELVP